MQSNTTPAIPSMGHCFFAFNPDGHVRLKSKSFTELINEVQQYRNHDIYRVMGLTTSKTDDPPKKSTMLGALRVWVEIDPPDELSGQALKEWRIGTYLAANSWRLPPSFIIFSGRGVWLEWTLEEKAKASAVEAVNRALVRIFKGDPHSVNINRIGRVPFTINQKTGEQANVVEGHEDRIYRIEDFPADAPSSVDEVLVDADVELKPDVHEVWEKYNLNRDTAALVRNGMEDKSRFNSRSEMLFHIVCELIRKKVPDSTILGLMIDRTNEGFAHLHISPKGEVRHGLEKNARRQLANAHKKVLEAQAEHASSSDDNEPVFQHPSTIKEPPKQRPAQVWELEDLGNIPEFLSDRNWLVPGILLRGAITMLQGKGGEGKSNWGLDLGASVAMGVDVLGFMPEERVKVLVLNAEDDKEEAQRRLRALELQLGCKVPSGWLMTKTLTRRQFAMVERSADGGIQETDTFRDIKLTIQHHNIGLLIVDPWIQATRGLEENDNNDMMDGLGLLADFARAQSIPLLGIHHNRKGSSTQGDGDAARGASAIRDAARIQLLLEGMTKEFWDSNLKPAYGTGDIGKHTDYVRLDVGKSNYGERLTDIWYRKRLHTVTQPKGHLAVAFERVTFGTMRTEAYIKGVDAEEWLKVEPIIAQGRGGDRLWSRATRGDKTERLTHLIQSQLGVDEDAATDLIRHWVKMDMLVEGMQRGTRGNKPVKVYALPGDHRLLVDDQGGLEL